MQTERSGILGIIEDDDVAVPLCSVCAAKVVPAVTMSEPIILWLDMIEHMKQTIEKAIFYAGNFQQRQREGKQGKGGKPKQDSVAPFSDSHSKNTKKRRSEHVF